VTNRETKAPAAREAMLITELMKDRGVIVFPNGIHDNVLKIKPPMVFDRSHVDIYVDTLDTVLSLPEFTQRPRDDVDRKSSYKKQRQEIQ